MSARFFTKIKIAVSTAGIALAFSGALGTASQASTENAITVGGVSRVYYVYIPKGFSTDVKVPVVYVLHPLTKDAAWAEQTMGWDKCADKNGFIVVYGQSNSPRGVWNAGLTPSETATGTDDVGYLEAVMDAVEGAYSIDMSRVYMVGFSAGAFMTAKMAVTVPGSLSAIATVEGLTGFASDELVPTSPISAIMIRGTSDDVVPYTGDVESSLFHSDVYSAIGSATDWAQADGCTTTPTTSTAGGGHIAINDYTGGTGGASVELATVSGGKHEYKPVDTDIIWQFFSSQSKMTSKP